MDPIATFRGICMQFPGVEEMPHFEKTSFRLKKKIFATLDQKNLKATVKLSLKEQDLFCLIDKSKIYPVPNKWGKQGWTNVEINELEEEILTDLLTTAFNQLASK